MPDRQHHISNDNSSHNSKHNHNEHWLHNILLKTGLATSGLIVTPYIGEALNIGSTTVPEIMHSFHGMGHATGLAGGIDSLLSSIPVVGEWVTAGSFGAAITSGVIGIGGVFLGNYLEKNAGTNNPDQIHWGKIIKYTALATSLLIALPSILTGISVGITYLASLFGAAGAVIPALAASIGTAGEMHSMATASAGIGSVLSHLITCGGAALSLTGAIYADNEPELQHKTKNTDKDKKNNGQDFIETEIINSAPAIKGQPYQILLRVRNKNGKILTSADLAESYGEKLHLLVVDKSLTDYHHIHPEYDAGKEAFAISFIPSTNNEYNVWSNFKLQENGQDIATKNKISSAKNYDTAPVIQHTTVTENGDIKIVIEANPPLASGVDSHLTCKIIHKSGNPIKLEEIMGAKAHLVGFNKDGDDMVHCHPIEDNATNSETLKFHIAPEKDGFTKFFLQTKIDGKETIIPFGQYVAASPKMAEREATRNNADNTKHRHH